MTLTRVLLAEAVVLALVAGLTRGLFATLVTAALAALLLPLLLARRQGRWWLEHHQLTRRLHRRRAAHRDTADGPLLAGLRTLAPGLTVRDVTGPTADGAGRTAAGAGRTAAGTAPSTVGVGRDEAGWFSVLALAPSTGPIPLDVLTGLLTATEQPGLVLQLVTRTIPAPGPDLPPASPAAASYRQLMEFPVPAHRESVISVRIDARTLAESLLDPTADPGAGLALTAGLARRVTTSLRRLGVTARPLGAAELLTTLAHHCDVAPDSTVDETWTYWRSAHLAHRTYWLRTWPARPTELFAWTAGAPVAQTTVSLLLRADEQGIAIRALLHLATHPDADLSALDRMLLDGATRMGAVLQPVDGEQGPALYATAPTGGGAG